jgi:predicted phosphodiesterase
MATKTVNQNRKSRPGPVLRNAFPFFSPLPPSKRPPHPAGNSGAAFAKTTLGPFPPKPKGNSTIALANIIGAPAVQEIQSAGSLRFHSVGDTGLLSGHAQQDVADAMTADFDVNKSAANPAFFFHLGDVIYGHKKEAGYRDEFYRPYEKYPGKIVAIPGNHDGETFAGTDPKPLAAFLANFCAPQALLAPQAKAAGVFRETMIQPGVYWMLDGPFAQIIGLYSNINEGPGDLEGAGGDQQQIAWLTTTLQTIAASRKNGPRKALIIGVHHPPFSQGGHSGSVAMLQQIDTVCKAAGIGPDALLAGHSHTYQRYTRNVTIGGHTLQVPYIVAGCGGHNDQAVGNASGQAIGDHTFVKSTRGYGYLNVVVDAHQLQIDFHLVLGPGGAIPPAGTKVFDSVKVTLATGKIS